jgi:hypothetical protein
VSPSDDGNLFVWEYASGRLVAVLPQPAAAAASGGDAPPGVGGGAVAPHPALPVLASAGPGPVVRLWSPEAEQQQGAAAAAAAAVQANLALLAEAGWQDADGHAGGLAGVLLGGGGRRRTSPVFAGPDRCRLM